VLLVDLEEVVQPDQQLQRQDLAGLEILQQLYQDKGILAVVLHSPQVQGEQVAEEQVDLEVLEQHHLQQGE
jgi:hypothetical protein